MTGVPLSAVLVAASKCRLHELSSCTADRGITRKTWQLCLRSGVQPVKSWNKSSSMQPPSAQQLHGCCEAVWRQEQDSA